MIRTREQLIHVLTEAAEIEHNLLCSYLYAVFSMKRAGEPGLTDGQAEAVERWRKTILKIGLEEMAHLACVNNLLIAIGGAPHFDRANFPAGVPFSDAYVDSRGEPTVDLRSNIAAEARAKIVYERLINITDDPGIKDALTFSLAPQATIRTVGLAC